MTERRGKPRFPSERFTRASAITAQGPYQVRVQDVSQTGARISFAGGLSPTLLSGQTLLGLGDRCVVGTVRHHQDGTIGIAFEQEIPEGLVKALTSLRDGKRKSHSYELESVPQRLFMSPDGSLVLNVATIGLDEALVQESFRDVVGQILGVPACCLLDQKQYQILQEAIGSGTLLAESSEQNHKQWEEDILAALAAKFETVTREPAELLAPLSLASDSLFLLCNPAVLSAYPMLALMQPSPYLRSYGIDAANFRLGLAVALARRFQEPLATAFIDEMMNCDIPIALSPGLKGSPLGSLLLDGKLVVTATTATALMHMHESHFVLAIETAAVGASILIIISVGVSFGDGIQQKLIQWFRGRGRR